MGDKQFSIRMPMELWERIRSDATDSDRSVGAQIRRILRRYYEGQDARDSNPLAEKGARGDNSEDLD